METKDYNLLIDQLRRMCDLSNKASLIDEAFEYGPWVTGEVRVDSKRVNDLNELYYAIVSNAEAADYCVTDDRFNKTFVEAKKWLSPRITNEDHIEVAKEIVYRRVFRIIKELLEEGRTQRGRNYMVGLEELSDRLLEKE